MQKSIIACDVVSDSETDIKQCFMWHLEGLQFDLMNIIFMFSHQDVTWMSFSRLVKRSVRGTQSGPSRLSQFGCMYSLALRWASLSQHVYS